MQKKLSDANFGVIIAVGIAVALTLAVFTVYALIITYTSATEESIQGVAAVTTLVSVLIAGITAAASTREKGWLYGMGTGLMYAVIMILLGLSLSPESHIGIKTLSVLALSVCGGGIGGMIGVNIKK